MHLAFGRAIPRWLKRFRSSSWKPSLDVARMLWFDYAHFRSVQTRSCIDAEQRPVPWYTYPAIEYLKQLDFSQASVFEYGSGNSTLFWASRAARVTSVDDDPKWYRIVSAGMPVNVELILETDLEEYATTIRRSGGRFEVIVVDGAARGNTRLKCSRMAVEHLTPGGMIILDNSDWLPESSRVLREAGLIEVDMTGFGPINRYSWTTSFFLHPSLAFKPKGPRQPVPGPAARLQIWEHPDPTDPPLVRCGSDVFGGVRRDERFTIDSPSGTRAFRLIASERRDVGMLYVALIDEQRQRVLLLSHERLAGRPVIEARLERVMGMSWKEFYRFASTHEQRRYDLAEDGT